MIWPLNRKPRIIDRRNMNEDWQVGDLAVCVGDDWEFPHVADPRAGEVLRVNHIEEGISPSGVRAFYLGFEGKPVLVYWEVVCFRKLRPNEVRAREEWRAMLRQPAPGKPTLDPKRHSREIVR